MAGLIERLAARWREGGVIGRALSETLGDWHVEARRAGTSAARVAAALDAVLACARVVSRWLTFVPGEHLVRNSGRDFRYAARRLIAAPVFAVFSIVSLALGIGASTAAYSSIRAALGPPPGLTETDRLVRVRHARSGSIPMIGLSWPDYQDLRARQTVFTGLAAWTAHSYAVAGGDRSENRLVESVSGDYFGTLGVSMAMGRAVHPADDRPGAPPVAVISHGVWQRFFSGSFDVLGRVVSIRGVQFQIVGVADGAFAGMSNGGITPTAAWVPFEAVRALPSSVDFDPDARDRRWLMLAGRLAPDRSIEEAAAQIATIARQLDSEFPIGQDLDARVRTSHRIGRPWDTRPITGRVDEAAGGRQLRWLGRALALAVVLVLLVACTNLANLMLARTSRRRHEFAVRRALGASRWRLVREVAAETVILSGVGGLVGLGVARVLITQMSADLPVDGGRFFLRLTPAVDLTVLIACGAATLTALLVSGVIPALKATRTDVRSALAAENTTAVSGRWRGRRYLITLQVGVSVALVSIAALCLAQIRAQSRIESGFDDDRVAVMDVDFRSLRYDEARTRQIVEAILKQIAQQPGVASAAASSGLPSGIGTPGGRAGTTSGRLEAITGLVAATPAIFDTLGVDVIRGRAFDERDAARAMPVAVISDRLAMDLFETGDVVGRSLMFRRSRWAGEPEQHPIVTLTIVGVAASAPTAPGSPSRHVVYLPWAQHYEGQVVFSARTSNDPAVLLGGLRLALRTVDSEAAPTRVTVASHLQDGTALYFWIVSTLSSVLGTLALVLALAGLYGVLSQLVAGRTREIGLRLALGAEASRIRRHLLIEGMSPVCVGLVLGVGIGGIALTGPMFRSVPPASGGALVAVAAFFLAAGLMACYLPALRASRVDPNVALRNL